MRRLLLQPVLLRLRTPIAAASNVGKPYQSLLANKPQIKLDMLVRETKPRKYHPRVQALHQQLTQPLEPLKYKLQEEPEGHDPLTPLGNVEHLPFFVQRTFSGNLPVYREYNHDHSLKRTVVRKITGDVEELLTELKKVCSNSSMKINVGKIIITGQHKIVVEDYLRRLGF